MGKKKDKKKEKKEVKLKTVPKKKRTKQDKMVAKIMVMIYSNDTHIN